MRRYPLSFLALILPSVACGQAEPDEPWMVVHRSGLVIMSIDTARITRVGEDVQLWVRLDSTPEDVPGEPGKTYTRVESLQRISCAAGTVHQERMRVLHAAGAQVAEYVEDTRWNTMSEHPMRQVYSALCEWLSRRPAR
jgi:hypothetical protein